MASSFHHRLVARSGARRSPRARARAPRAGPPGTSTAARSRRRASRASPTSSASRRDRTPRAPRSSPSRRHGSAASIPGTGSRSTRSSSGWSRSSARTGCGFRSMQPRFTIRELRRVGQHDLVRRRPDGKLSVTVSIHPGGRRRALLEEELSRRAVHVTLERHRPPADAAERPLGHVEVVADEVELRVPGLREIDLVGVRDRDLAAAISRISFLVAISRQP